MGRRDRTEPNRTGRPDGLLEPSLLSSRNLDHEPAPSLGGEREGRCREPRCVEVHGEPEPAAERHLPEADRESAVGNVVRRSNEPATARGEEALADPAEPERVGTRERKTGPPVSASPEGASEFRR